MSSGQMAHDSQQTIVVRREPGTSGLAIAGLVFSILGWFTLGLLCIPGAFLSFLALFRPGPKGTAIAGLIVGFPGTFLFVLLGAGLIAGLLGLGAASMSAVEEARRSGGGLEVVVAERSIVDPESELAVADALIQLQSDLSDQSHRTFDATANAPSVDDDVLLRPEQDEMEADSDEFRTWTSASGTHTTEAKVVSYANGRVTLENREGKRTRVDIEQLSNSDRDFVNDWKRRPRRTAGAARSVLSGAPSGEARGAPTATLLRSELVDFSDASGRNRQKVVVHWKNSGSTPIRAIDAEITHRDELGAILGNYNYTIFAALDDEPGVMPSETHTTKGFDLPSYQGMPGYRTSKSVEVRLTDVLEYSGL